MIIIKHDGHKWRVWLRDDGTMDTVIGIEPVNVKLGKSSESRFDSEYAASYRSRDGAMTLRGLRELGKQAAESYDTGS